MENEKKIEKNMLRERSPKLPEVTDEMWSEVLELHRELFDEFFSVNIQLSKQSVKQYKSGMKQWFYWVHIKLKDKPMYKISKRDFLKYRSFLHNYGLSSKSISFKQSSVSTLCNFIENVIADDEEDFANFRNFTRGLPKIPMNKVYEKVKVTREEYEFMMKELLEREKYMECAWLATAFNVGARRSEIIQFKTEIIDYEIPEGQNYVLSHNVRGKGSGSEGKIEKYMINIEALKYIKLWLEKRGHDHEYIFTTKMGNQISESWANEFCASTLSPLLDRRINVHIFKASCITALLEQGVDIQLVSKFVAQHEDVSTTAKFYDLRDFEQERNKIF